MKQHTNCGTSIPWNGPQQSKQGTTDTCHKSDGHPGTWAKEDVVI